MNKKMAIFSSVLVLFSALASTVFAQGIPDNPPSRLPVTYPVPPPEGKAIAASPADQSFTGSFSPGLPDNYPVTLPAMKATEQLAAGQSEIEPGIQFTKNGANKWFTDWSPDGKWITYAQIDEDGLWDVWIKPATGGEPINLTGDRIGTFYFPNFSLNSLYVLFTNGAESSVEMINIESGEYSIVLENAVNGFWSNTGRYFVWRIADTSELAIFDSESTDSWLLADGDNAYGVSCFSPDDSFVVTSVVTEEGEKLFFVPVEGGGFEQITFHEGRHWHPNISPDGEWMLYTSYDMEWVDSKLWAYNFESGESQVVFPDQTAVQSTASFSPTGKRFSYLLAVNAAYEVFVADFKFGDDEPFIDITAPDGGETLIAGAYYDITWESAGIPKVRIDFSPDGGSTWKLIAKDIDASEGWFGWEAVPNVESENCYIRIIGISADGNIVDEDWEDWSDEAFSVSPAPHLRVITPNGGEKWTGGQTYSIKWEARNVDTVSISFMPNNDRWLIIGKGINASAGSWDWTLPETPAENCRIRVADESGSQVYSDSYAVFTIVAPAIEPKDNFTLGSTMDEVKSIQGDPSKINVYDALNRIIWNYGFSTVTFSYDNKIVIEYEESSMGDELYVDMGSQISGSFFNLGSTQSEVIAAQGTPSAVHIYESLNNIIWNYGFSTVTFSYDNKIVIEYEESSMGEKLNIGESIFITLTSPIGGEKLEVLKDFDITWDAANIGTIALSYATDGGSFWKQIATGVDASAGSFTWHVANDASTDCRVRILNESDPKMQSISTEPFSILRAFNEPWVRVESPNNGEKWQAGEEYDIVWEPSGELNLTIRFSPDGGKSWSEIATDISGDAGWYGWAIPRDVQSETCKIWVGDTGYARRFDTSDGIFTILPSSEKPYVEVLSPNGGEEWKVGEFREITWSSFGVEKVNIWISKDSALEWELIAEGIDAGPGSYTWPVPMAYKAQECYISVGDANDSSLYDICDGPFSITGGEPSGLLAKDYIPFGEGLTWSWDGVEKDPDGSIIDSYEYSQTMTGTTVVDGKTYWVVSEYEEPDNLYRIENNILYVYMGEAFLAKTHAKSQTLQVSEAPYFDFNQPEGGTWPVYSHTETGDGYSTSITMTGQYLGTEDIVVPAGSYTNCAVFRIVINVTSTSGSETDSYTYGINSILTTWVAPDTGPVKFVQKDKELENGELVYDTTTTEVLKKFTRDGAYIELLSPSGGERWAAGSTQTITWSSTGVSSVDITYSIDGGINWKVIVEKTDAAKESFTWEVPNDPSDNCKVKVIDVSDLNHFDESDDPFEILKALNNENANFALDTNLGEAGQQNNLPVGNVGPGDPVGFAVYAADWLTTSTARITMTWDPGKAAFAYMLDSMDGRRVDINGANIVLPAEKNVLAKSGGTVTMNITEQSEGSITLLLTGASNLTAAAPVISSGLALFAAFETTSDFGADDSIIIEVNVNLSDKSGIANDLGIRRFRVFSRKTLLSITTPAGDDELIGGEPFEITWTSEGISKIRIEMSVDNGVNWFPVAEDVDASAGRHEITIPLENSTECLVRAFNMENDEMLFESDLFSIMTEDAPTLTLTSPSGGEQLIFGQPYTIEWESENVPEIRIALSTEGGVKGSFVWIATNVDASVGSFEWNDWKFFDGNDWTPIEEINSTECVIGLIQTDNAEVVDYSGRFTITPGEIEPSVELLTPNGGERWEVDSTQRIEWTAQGVDTIELVIYFEGFEGDGPFWLSNETKSIDASIGYYDWTVVAQDNREFTECYIGVREFENFNLKDYNDEPITIYTAPFIEITDPSGGEEWTVRSEQYLFWDSASIDKVKIEYSTDNGATYKVIESAYTDWGGYVWTVPEDVSNDCKVKVSDASNSDLQDVSEGTFSIIKGNFVSVTSPNKGQAWAVGAVYDIRWTFEGVDTVRIELSTDNGENWEEIAASVSASTAMYTWLVPDRASTQCKIRLTDVSNDTVTGESEAFSIAKSEINIQHTPITTKQQNDEIIFSAQVTSNEEIKQVMIYYDQTGDRVFDNQLEMTDSGGGNYTATLQAGIFTARGMEYYITASDTASKETRTPVGEDYHSIDALVSNIKSVQTVKGGSAQTSYRMVSIPLALKEKNIVNQLLGRLPQGEMGPDWRIFRYSPGSDTPGEYPNIQGFTPGTAYWVIATDDFQLSAAKGNTVTTSGSFRIDLEPGWNDIANPWQFDISWSDIENPSGANLSALYSYQGKWSDPTSYSKTMESWEGYAVKNLETSARIIYLQPKSALAVGKQIADISVADWKLSIIATAGLAVDSANHIGVRADASDEWDRHDHVEPPPVGDYVSVLFPHRDWTKYPYDYTVDFRPPGDTVSWNFDVKSNIGRERISIDIEGVGELPERYALFVLDRTSGKPVELSGTTFGFISDNGITERQYTLVITTDEELGGGDNPASPEQFITASSYPNPFNPQATIRYTLSMPGMVKISVFNSVGQSVRVYDHGFRSQGVHEFVFDAADLTTGLYIFRVESGKASVTNKMLFMK